MLDNVGFGPKRLSAQVDRLQIEAAFSDLPQDDRINPFDQMLSQPK